MNLEHHVSQLLYRYSCVVVPGFGGFLTEIKSANLNENTNMFSPPRKLVSFNANLQNNDGLIANHIAISDKISYDNSVRFIATEVASWKNNLENNGVLNIKNIGDFSLNSDSKLVFVPSDDLNYLTTSFGMNAFVSPFVKREIENKVFKFNHELENETFSTKKIEKIEELEEEVSVSDNKVGFPSYLKYAAVLLVSAGIAGSFGYKIYQDKLTKNQLLVEIDVQKKVESKIQQATFFISNPLPDVVANVTPVLNYHVVAGAFKKLKNAEKEYNKLVSKGFEAKILSENKFGLIPVLYGSFASYVDARKEMNRIQRSSNPDAWVLIQELN
jgi:CCDC81-like prokaryotic HU domain 1/CCDC81-like prokaryotic HU domain 2/SPOR domain